MRRSALAANILLSLASLLVFFFMLESVQRIRYWRRHNDTYWLKYGFVRRSKETENKMTREIDNQYEKEHGHARIRIPVSMKKNYFKITPGDHPLKRHKDEFYHVNRMGFRGKEFSKKKEPNTYRIVVLGASSTFGVYNEDDFTYPALLEKMINNENNKRRFEVINAGIGGFTLFNIRNLFEEEIAGFEPDCIIINSVFNNWAVPYYGATPCRNILRLLSTKSLFLLTMMEKLSIIIKGRADNLYIDWRETAKNVMIDNKLWDNYRSDLQNIAKYCKDNNITLILVKQGINYIFNAKAGDESLAIWRDVRDRAYSIISEVSEQNGLTIADYTHLAGTAQSGDYFVDVIHLTNRGNEKVAGVIRDCLVRGGIIEP
ncbi:MAG: hypothetical protein A2Z72_05420 [Omnitrophica bacterium RBG_13_46_9]|nr:MAG: hypothetical protein A2Z72_05420 [Omnitrophica bacterium RBG_13_46_9]